MGRIPSVQNVGTIIEKDLFQKVLSTCKMERIFLIPAERDQLLKNLWLSFMVFRTAFLVLVTAQRSLETRTVQVSLTECKFNKPNMCISQPGCLICEAAAPELAIVHNVMKY